MTAILQIQNNDQLILASNYWNSDYARAGKVYLSVNAGAFRLLLPDLFTSELADMRTALEVIISRRLWPAQRCSDAIELLFDDWTDNPYAPHIGTEQIDRLPLDRDTGREVVCTVWTRGPKLEIMLPAHNRRSAKLPDRRPWSNGHAA
jgi:hypothetical protein